ncbi:MAG: hypothetical protein DMG33_16500, partial [Acidobacteria bacterium]
MRRDWDERARKNAGMALKVLFQGLARWRWIRRLYAALSGAPMVGSHLRRLALRMFPPRALVWTHISSGPGKGLWVHLDPRFEMDYAKGNYEASIQRALSSHLRPGSVFYDVGAHIGILSLLAARLVGPAGSVFSFEADPANAERIEEHVRRNEFRQIHIVPRAVWRTAGRLRFERASAQSSRNQGVITTEPAASTANTIEVKAIALDDFSRGHLPPTLIKIDVEGAEADVLGGSEEVFASARPVLICEIHHERAAEEVTQWLRERGYTFEWFTDILRFPRHLLARHA